METLKIISDREWEAIDPVTGGTWKIMADHTLSEFGVMKAIEYVLLNEDIRPKRGSVLTVHFSLTFEQQEKEL